MQQQALPRLFMIQRLYRRVLKLHRSLPSDLKKLGDEYAKDEFRRNKGANQLQAYEFINEWKVMQLFFYIYICILTELYETKSTLPPCLQTFSLLIECYQFGFSSNIHKTSFS